ncbi:MAG: hypothetical protein U0L26_15610 [Cellulosilyticum sp.]|nr:hypothetical protein [Cellulosilyticum sp.]
MLDEPFKYTYHAIGALTIVGAGHKAWITAQRTVLPILAEPWTEVVIELLHNLLGGGDISPQYAHVLQVLSKHLMLHLLCHVNHPFISLIYMKNNILFFRK